MLPPLRYVVPVHNDAPILQAAVTILVGELSRRPPERGVHHVLLVENGSSDDSFRVATELSGSRDGVHVHAFHEDSAGIGWAYDRGIREALAIEGDRASTWLVLTASDLPFEFSDLDSFERWGARGRLAIGSKAHPDSVVPVSLLRATSTLVYRLARRALVGMRTGDSQGSFFLRADAAAEFAPAVRARDFFHTTELVYHAERAGEPIAELPVRLAPSRRASTVRPLKHGAKMLRALLALRSQRS
jgi:glycosyltransferase involved in cell wall biosynthesis